MKHGGPFGARFGARRASQQEAFEGGPGSGPRKGSGGKITKVPPKTAKDYERIERKAKMAGRGKRDIQGGDWRAARWPKEKKLSKADKVYLKDVDYDEESEAGYVDQRYDSSHPEGFVSPEYPDMKSGVEGGQGSGPSKRELQQKARQRAEAIRNVRLRKKTESKGWTGRQKDMHAEIGRQIAMESRRGSSGPVTINSSPENPATLPYERPLRENGWRGGIAFSPPVARVKAEVEGKFELKEF